MQLGIPDWEGKKGFVKKLQNLTVELEQKRLHGVAKGHHWELPAGLVSAQQVHLMAPISGTGWVVEA